uniref:Uncharacterized protein n=1 Tax=Romanomermis culicivorax TaxID=13658 RepID=A0A915IU93_ROMCU
MHTSVYVKELCEQTFWKTKSLMITHFKDFQIVDIDCLISSVLLAATAHCEQDKRYDHNDYIDQNVVDKHFIKADYRSLIDFLRRTECSEEAM